MKLYLGETIKRLRQQKGLTQEQLADKLGVSFQSVSRWEGGSSYPDIELIPEIAGFFHVSIDELMGMDQSLRDKKLNEALQQLAGNVPLEERVKIQRQIHRDFPHDSGALYGLIHTLGE
nr:helix-turn-helix domain-containing protein [Clostridiales bacterium]